MRTPAILEHLTERIEAASVLDRPAAALAAVLRPMLAPAPVEDTLSGVPLGHPVHPLLVTVPIGAWVSAGVLDLAGDAEGARTLTGLGCLAALPAAATGASDWLSTAGAERRVGFVHALANYTALGGYAASWLARRRGSYRRGVAWSLLSAAALGVAGWFGGHLAYAQGVGVDTTAFAHFPAEWTDVGGTDKLPRDGSLTALEVDGVALLASWRDGRWVVLAGRCTHRGGPLHEGAIASGCVTCPWHGSVFSLDDGSVRSGPATRPQPVLESRVREGRLEVRRIEARTLRTNPVGA